MASVMVLSMAACGNEAPTTDGDVEPSTQESSSIVEESKTPETPVVEEVSVDRKLLNAIYSVYVVIHSAEATSNMSNLTGFIFGPRGKGDNYIEMMKNYRTNGFSSLIKRRFIIGSYVLQAENKERYFHNAARVRRLLVDTWNNLFKEYDAIILPVGTGPAKYLDKTKNEINKSTTILEEHLNIGNFDIDHFVGIHKFLFEDLINSLQTKLIVVSYNNTYDAKSSSSNNTLLPEEILAISFITSVSFSNFIFVFVPYIRAKK